MRLRVAAMAIALSGLSSAGARPARAEAQRPSSTEDAARNAADAAITVRVERQIADAAPAAQHLQISTRNGIVTLEGRVESERMRRRVVSLALTTDGVVDVNNQLVIVPPAGHS